MEEQQLRQRQPTHHPQTLKANPKIHLVEGEGFEPSKAEPSDLQSDPFDRSGTPPNETEHYGDFPYLCQTVGRIGSVSVWFLVRQSGNFLQGPYVIGDSGLHCRSNPEGLMDA